MLVQQCASCNALLICERCLKSIKPDARVEVVHGDGVCHAVHVPDCFTASWRVEGLLARLLGLAVAGLGFGWLAQSNPALRDALLRLLPR